MEGFSHEKDALRIAGSSVPRREGSATPLLTKQNSRNTSQLSPVGLLHQMRIKNRIVSDPSIKLSSLYQSPTKPDFRRNLFRFDDLGIMEQPEADTVVVENIFKREGLVRVMSCESNSPQKQQNASPFKIVGHSDHQTVVLDANLLKLADANLPVGKENLPRRTQSVESCWMVSQPDPNKVKQRHLGTRSARSVSGLVSRMLQCEFGQSSAGQLKQSEWISATEREFKRRTSLVISKQQQAKAVFTNLSPQLLSGSKALLHKSQTHLRCIDSVADLANIQHEPVSLAASRSGSNRHLVDLSQRKLSASAKKMTSTTGGWQCRSTVGLKSLDNFLLHADTSAKQAVSSNNSRQTSPGVMLAHLTSKNEESNWETARRNRDSEIKSKLLSYRKKEMLQRTKMTNFLKSYDVSSSIKDAQIGGFSERPLEERASEVTKLEVHHIARKQVLNEFQVFRDEKVVNCLPRKSRAYSKA